ncbi:MAG: hypothetical protein ACRDJ9_35530, partial [Dehalococcoidia bacterium]
MRHLVPPTLLGVLLIVGLLGLSAAPARAQDTEPRRAFVYGINAATPDSYVGTFAPPSVDTIYLLADRTSVISPRITEIYFWPITNEYRPNWSRLNDPVPGVLEISRGGEIVAELEATDYTIHYRTDGRGATSEIFLGGDAIEAHRRFQARQEAFRQASADYY